MGPTGNDAGTCVIMNIALLVLTAVGVVSGSWALSSLAWSTLVVPRLRCSIAWSLAAHEYIHGVTAHENRVISYNRAHADQLAPYSLAMVYPRDGTFWSTHPMCTLDAAAWTDARTVEAAALLQQWLLAPAQQHRLLDFGLRPLVPPTTPAATVSSRSALPPIAGSTPLLAFLSRTLCSRWRMVLALQPIRATRRRVRRDGRRYDGCHLDVEAHEKGRLRRGRCRCLGFDGRHQPRGGQGGRRLPFVAGLQPADQLALVSFAKAPVLNLFGAMGSIAGNVTGVMDRWVAEGSTALYDALAYSVKLLNKQRTLNAAAESTGRFYSVILVTDGLDQVVGELPHCALAVWSVA